MLFSDIEGSTVLLSQLGNRYGEALSAQRTVIRAAISDCRGHELGTEGDSFFVVFESAADAVACCVRAHRGHAVLDLRSPHIEAGEIRIDVELDHAMLKLLVPDGAVIDDWDL